MVVKKARGPVSRGVGVRAKGPLDVRCDSLTGGRRLFSAAVPRR